MDKVLRKMLLSLSFLLAWSITTGLNFCGDQRNEPLRKSEGRPRTKSCSLECKDDEKSCEFAKLSCPAGRLIYGPEVFGVRSENGIVRCKGLTSRLLSERNECYWKNVCKINFPVERTIVKPEFGPPDCFGKCIQTVDVKRWKCIRKSIVHTMCDQTKHFTIDTMDKRYGIIRSHASFPWLYDDDMFPGEHVTVCDKAFHPHVESVERGYTKVAIQTDFLEMRMGYENLTIKNNGGEYLLDNTIRPGVRVFQGEVTIKMERLKNQHKNSHVGGSGFVICFKFLGKNEVADENLCETMMTFSKKKAKCTTCKYKKRGTEIHNLCNDVENVREFNVTLHMASRKNRDVCKPWKTVDVPCRKNKPTSNSRSRRKKTKRRDGNPRCRYKKRGTLVHNHCNDVEKVREYNVTLHMASRKNRDGCEPWKLVKLPCKKRKPTPSRRTGRKPTRRRDRKPNN